MVNRALGGAAWTATTTLAQLVIQLGVLAVLGRLLTPRDFGLTGIATAVAAFASILGQLGVGQALIQRRELDDESVRTAFTVSLASGLGVSTIVLLTAPSLAALFGEAGAAPFIRFLVLSVLATSLGTTAEALLNREMRFRNIAVITLISYITGFVLFGVPLAIAGAGAWALASAQLVQAVTKTIFCYIQRPHSTSLFFAVTARRTILSFGSGITLSKLLNVLALQGDNLIVARTLGATSLGLYSRAYQLMRIPVQVIGQSMANVLFPALSRIQDTKASLRDGYLTAASIATLLGGIASSMFVVTAPDIITTLLGAGWEQAVTPFRILSIALPFSIAYKLDDTLAKATSAIARRLVRDVVYVAAILIGVSLGVKWGITGAAVSVSLAIATNYLLGLAMSLSITGLTVASYMRAQISSMTITAISYIVSLALKATVSNLVSNAVASILIVFIGTVSAIVALVILTPRLLTPQQRQLFGKAMESLVRLPFSNFLRRRVGQPS